ncbi:hypothetical protein POX_a01289 [Penicillium oxalicum]|uniref:hypothetical protein n=1 Tax=Penicillium oxalicum TaxID=69781 RepID=UPI0020B7FD0A|nr:hypothetical protein POX_a01289 [Penicillium oxalicum]KAI2794688.1 hypothetical protein POX_a01289 [Penicillium oxalicum]
MKFSHSLALSGLLASVSAVPMATGPSGKWFDRFVVVVMENTNKDTALADPYYRQLADEGVLLDGYQGTTHPSQPNYITMISSTTAAGVYDDADHNTTQGNLIDILEPAGISWRAYMEGYYPLAGGACNPLHQNQTSGYVRKHNPFMSFDNIRENTARCQKIVNAEEHFAADVAKGKYAPQYMYYTPTLKNDAHDTNITYTETDLKCLINTMKGNEQFMKNTLIIVTFDENDIYSPDSYGTSNDVYTVLLGKDTLSCTGCVDKQFYNHFTQLTTIEQNWGLSHVPNTDGNGAMWDSWMVPFNTLKAKNHRN